MSVLIASVLFLSCNQKQPSPPSELELAKTELAALLKNEGAAFAPKTDIYEDENATVTILKARNETDTLQVSAGRLREGLLLGAIRVKDKKTSQADTYTSTLVVRDSATFLRLVNSAWFGLPQPIGRPTAAVAYLGLSEIQRLVVMASVVNTFRSFNGPELRQAWHHATLTGLVARQLTRSRARWLSSSVAWTLGLLHDIGALVRLTVDPDVEQRVVAYTGAQEALPEEAEAALGLAPSTAWGRALCEQWRLPSLFVLVAGHHRTGVAPKSATVDDAAYLALVSAASLIARLVARPLREDVRAGVATRVCMLLDCDAEALWDLLASAHSLNVEAEAAVNDLLRGA